MIIKRLHAHFVLFFIIFLTSLTTQAAEKPKLTVYTYSSFVGEWGPGSKIEQAFEKTCDCDLVFIGFDGAIDMFGRLKMEGDKTPADIALGLDMNLLAEAKKLNLWTDHQVDTKNLKLPIPWEDTVFVPYDYGFFSVVYNKMTTKDIPTSFKDFIQYDPQQKLLISDPRSSTPGLGFLLTLQKIYGDKAAMAWQIARAKVLTVTKSSSESWALFKKGEAPFVWAYTTSPLYYAIAEKNNDYAAINFDEGNYMQIEVAGRLKTSKNPDLAQKFLQFILTPEFQEHIPTNNWMLPVIDLGDKLPEPFKQLVQPKPLLFTPEEVASHRKEWINQWLDYFGQVAKR